MLETPPREKEWVSWLLVTLWTLVIFATIPLARTIQGVVQDRWGGQTFAYLVVAAVLGAAATAFAHLRRRRLPSRRNYVWLLAISAIFLGGTYQLRSNPEEALHFVQYGALGLLTYRALSHRMRDPTIYFVAALIGSSVGILDEAIQWVTPRRFWGLRDIWLNALAASLAQVAIAKGLRPSLISDSPRPASIRLLCRLGVVTILLFGASLLNTPARVGWYADRIAFLDFLKTNQSVMFEYGHLYVDPEIGQFRSRLSPAELRRLDATRGAEAAKILNRFRESSDYQRYLRTYTPVTDPFVHELRVHLFSRDRSLERAQSEEPGSYRARQHVTVAMRENRILEKYFANALRHSTYVLRPERLEALQRKALPEYEFESLVSQDLQTTLREWQIVTALGFALLGLLVLERFHREAETRR